MMRWTLRAKLLHNWRMFSSLLLRTGDKPIVEISYRDPFWGAKPQGEYLVGTNALGRLLMELREELKGGGCTALEPLDVPEFLLFGKPIERMERR